MAQRILIVEDEPAIAEAVEYALKAEGFEVEAVDNGNTALEQARDRAYDLLVLDLMLPGLSGVEVCRRIKRNNPGQRMMICSAAILPNHEDALTAIGVAHFLTKPYHPEDLIAHIAREIGPRARPAWA